MKNLIKTVLAIIIMCIFNVGLAGHNEQEANKKMVASFYEAALNKKDFELKNRRVSCLTRIHSSRTDSYQS